MIIEPWHWWLIAGILLCILEVFTGDLLLLGLGLAALGGSLSAASEATVSWQIGTFAISALIFVFGVRPIAKKHLYKTSDSRATNVGALIDRVGVVVESIDGHGMAGRVKLGAEEWRALAEVPISVAEHVIVERVEGATLFVKKKD